MVMPRQMRLRMKTKKGQMKIQEMAFVLIAIVVFFSLVIMIYLSIRMGSLRESAEEARTAAAQELVLRLAVTPEFSWRGCLGTCIDLEKALALKDKKDYKGFWDIDFLMLERIYPNATKKECTKGNFPDCSTLTIVNNTKYIGTPRSTFVALCSFDAGGNYERCGLGKIYASEKAIT